MPYKNQEDANARQRERYATEPAFRRGMKEATKKWAEDNKEQYNDYRAAWAKEDRDAHRSQYAAYEFSARLRKYHTTVEWYRDKLIEQLGVCAICGHISYFRGKMQSLSVDHDHECCNTKAKSCGECNRGLLCVECNMKLSYLEQILYESFLYPEPCNNTWLEKALKYLRKYRLKQAK